MGFSNATLQWMSSILMDRQQRVRVNGCLSTSKSPKSGIPQGTVLGPVLFLVYINDLPCSISSDCSIFADDPSVYNTGSNPPSICSMLSKDLNYAANWAAEWGMLFNAEKSEHLAFSTRKSDITSPHVIMNGTQIPQVTSHKHLGVNFNNTLSWQKHVVARNRDLAAVTASLCILAHVAQSCCTQAARMLKSRSSTCMWSARCESGTLCRFFFERLRYFQGVLCRPFSFL